jgi:hypothetical protein
MGFMEQVGNALEQAAREIERALDKGKGKVGELQVEMQMDGLAKKLGYLVFDFYRGRSVDQAVRQKLLDDLSRLEDQLLKIRAEAAAKAEAAAQERAARKAQYGQQTPPGTQTGWEETPPSQPWDAGTPPQQSWPEGETQRPPGE